MSRRGRRNKGYAAQKREAGQSGNSLAVALPVKLVLTRLDRTSPDISIGALVAESVVMTLHVVESTIAAHVRVRDKASLSTKIHEDRQVSGGKEYVIVIDQSLRGAHLVHGASVSPHLGGVDLGSVHLEFHRNVESHIVLVIAGIRGRRLLETIERSENGLAVRNRAPGTERVAAAGGSGNLGGPGLGLGSGRGVGRSGRRVLQRSKAGAANATTETLRKDLALGALVILLHKEGLAIEVEEDALRVFESEDDVIVDGELVANLGSSTYIDADAASLHFLVADEDSLVHLTSILIRRSVTRENRVEEVDSSKEHGLIAMVDTIRLSVRHCDVVEFLLF